MKRTIRNLVLTLAMALMPALAFAGPVYAAAQPCGNTPAEKQVFSGVDQTETMPTCNDSGVSSAISAAVKILSLVVGAAAIIAIINGGFKYVTSGGDSNKVANAKSTLIYALIGVVIAVLAQLIVRFVVSTSNSAVQCPSGQTLNASNVCAKS